MSDRILTLFMAPAALIGVAGLVGCEGHRSCCLGTESVACHDCCDHHHHGHAAGYCAPNSGTIPGSWNGYGMPPPAPPSDWYPPAAAPPNGEDVAPPPPERPSRPMPMSSARPLNSATAPRLPNPAQLAAADAAVEHWPYHAPKPSLARNSRTSTAPPPNEFWPHVPQPRADAGPLLRVE